MNIFKQSVEGIKRNKKRKEESKVNCIPFPNFKRLSNVIPGIIQGTNWIVGANSGVGKTQFTKNTFVFEPLHWLFNVNDSDDINIKILYFALEESKDEFMLSMISHKLREKYNIMVDPLELKSMFEEDTVNDDLIKKIETLQPEFDKILNHLTIVDSISNPYGIYKYIRNYSKENGTHYYYNFKTDKSKENTVTEAEYLNLPDSKNWAYSHYVPNNPDEYVICIVDHIGLITPENTDTLHQSMSKLSADYGRKQITKHFNYVFVMVQQMSAATEEQAFNYKGDKIIEKLKPNLSNLADNKLTARDCHVVMALFAPDRYGIDDYNGFDITRLGDQYRSLLVLKNRIGRGNIEVPMYFNGAVTKFRELPKSMSAKEYELIEEIQKKMR